MPRNTHFQTDRLRRDGAVFWGLFVDTNQSDRFIENFVTETWVEHLRQHERTIASDVVYESRARPFDLGNAPRTTHLISADAVAGGNVGSFQRERGDRNGTSEQTPALKKVQL